MNADTLGRRDLFRTTSLREDVWLRQDQSWPLIFAIEKKGEGHG